MKIHICKQKPCPVQDAECLELFNNGFKGIIYSKGK